MPHAYRSVSRRRLMLAVVAGAVLVSACFVPVAPRYVGEPVYAAPPPDRVEEIGAPPVAGYLWLGGYWGWVGGRHEWMAGHWVRPRPGYAWVPHRWVQEGRGWRLQDSRV